MGTIRASGVVGSVRVFCSIARGFRHGVIGMAYDSTGWAYRGERVKVVKKMKTVWIIEKDGQRFSVDPSELATIKKVKK